MEGRMRELGSAAALAAALLCGGLSAQAEQRNFRTSLSGQQEVPPVDTSARGQATFRSSSDGTSLQFQLVVANIQNVTQAHIHLGESGVNGPVVAWLYPPAPPAQLISGGFQGVLSAGEIRTDDLVGPLGGQPLQTLLAQMAAGTAYVNVHTSQVPAGEIRGQIR
jgi:hypothetical protein